MLRLRTDGPPSRRFSLRRCFVLFVMMLFLYLLTWKRTVKGEPRVANCVVFLIALWLYGLVRVLSFTLERMRCVHNKYPVSFLNSCRPFSSGSSKIIDDLCSNFSFKVVTCRTSLLLSLRVCVCMRLCRLQCMLVGLPNISYALTEYQ